MKILKLAIIFLMMAFLASAVSAACTTYPVTADWGPEQTIKFNSCLMIGTQEITLLKHALTTPITYSLELKNRYTGRSYREQIWLQMKRQIASDIVLSSNLENISMKVISMTDDSMTFSSKAAFMPELKQATAGPGQTQIKQGQKISIGGRNLTMISVNFYDALFEVNGVRTVYETKVPKLRIGETGTVNGLKITVDYLFKNNTVFANSFVLVKFPDIVAKKTMYGRAYRSASSAAAKPSIFRRLSAFTGRILGINWLIYE